MAPSSELAYAGHLTADFTAWKNQVQIFTLKQSMSSLALAGWKYNHAL